MINLDNIPAEVIICITPKVANKYRVIPLGTYREGRSGCRFVLEKGRDKGDVKRVLADLSDILGRPAISSKCVSSERMDKLLEMYYPLPMETVRMTAEERRTVRRLGF